MTKMKKFNVCPAVMILLALTVACKSAAGVPVTEIPHETGGHQWNHWQDFPSSMFEWIASLHTKAYNTGQMGFILQ